LDDSVNDAHEHNGGDDDALKDDKVEFLFVGTGSGEECVGEQHCTENAEEEDYGGGTTEVIACVYFAVSGVRIDTGDNGADCACEEGESLKADDRDVTKQSFVCIFPCTDPESEVRKEGGYKGGGGGIIPSNDKGVCCGNKREETELGENETPDGYINTFRRTILSDNKQRISNNLDYTIRKVDRGGMNTSRYYEQGNITCRLTESVLYDIEDVEDEEDGIERDEDNVDFGSGNPDSHFMRETWGSVEEMWGGETSEEAAGRALYIVSLCVLPMWAAAWTFPPVTDVRWKIIARKIDTNNNSNEFIQTG
jgi:hypothetical protein